MFEFLGQHPSIFPCRTKEPNFFNTDFPRRYPLVFDDYIDLFNGGEHHPLRMEGTVWYLSSTVAARNIYNFDPHARIIIMLRHPVEAMYSLHSQHVYAGKEPELDFMRAVERDNRTDIPPVHRNGPAELQQRHYLKVFSYTDQVKRYMDLFDPSQLRIIFFDDFKRDLDLCIRETLQFLEIDDRFKPDTRVVNAHKVPRIPALQRFIQAPPAWIEKSFATLVPSVTRRNHLRAIAMRINSHPAKREKLPPDYVRQLTNEMAGDIQALGDLLGRDLGNWLENKPLPPVKEVAGDHAEKGGAD